MAAGRRCAAAGWLDGSSRDPANSFSRKVPGRHALIEFREVYNATWLIERHGFRPPAAIRTEQLLLTAEAA